jgi:hypothetical protein
MIDRGAFAAKVLRSHGPMVRRPKVPKALRAAEDPRGRRNSGTIEPVARSIPPTLPNFFENRLARLISFGFRSVGVVGLGGDVLYY